MTLKSPQIQTEPSPLTTGTIGVAQSLNRTGSSTPSRTSRSMSLFTFRGELLGLSVPSQILVLHFHTSQFWPVRLSFF